MGPAALQREQTDESEFKGSRNTGPKRNAEQNENMLFYRDPGCVH